MLFLIESAVLCALFTLMIPMGLMRDPIKGIMSYPTAIRKRVESLPQYQGSIHREERGHLLKKALSIPAIVLILAAVLWYSGQRAFLDAYVYSFGLFTVVNLWDLVVIDWLWFCHSKRVRLSGTEDMVKEYRDPWFHLLGFFKGCAIGAAVSLLAAGAVALLSLWIS